MELGVKPDADCPAGIEASARPRIPVLEDELTREWLGGATKVAEGNTRDWRAKFLAVLLLVVADGLLKALVWKPAG